MSFEIVESIRRALTGKVIHKSDVTLASKVTISLRLKAKGDDAYVVMACTAPGNYQYYPMDLREFEALTDAVLKTKAAIENSRPTTS